MTRKASCGLEFSDSLEFCPDRMDGKTRSPASSPSVPDPPFSSRPPPTSITRGLIHMCRHPAHTPLPMAPPQLPQSLGVHTPTSHTSSGVRTLGRGLCRAGRKAQGHLGREFQGSRYLQQRLVGGGGHIGLDRHMPLALGPFTSWRTVWPQEGHSKALL